MKVRSVKFSNFAIGVIAFSVVSLVFALLLSILPVSAANTFPRTYELVSVNNVDGQGVNRNATVSGVSFDASKVLFSTTASNLPLATPGIQEWGGFMRDMNAATTTRIDLSSSGNVPDMSTVSHKMSFSGRYVIFASRASNIIDGTVLNDSVQRIYFKDLQTNVVELLTNVSNVTATGGVIGHFTPISVSDDGRLIVVATNVINSIIPGTRTGSVPADTRDLAIYDRALSTWTLVNQPSPGTTIQSDNIYKAASTCDGSLTVFSTTANNLISNYSGSGKHVYLADFRNGLYVTDLTHGSIGDSIEPAISCDGRYVTYSTTDRTLVSPTPSGMSTDMQVVHLDRFTEQRQYLDFWNTSLASYNGHSVPSIPTTVSNKGDIVFPAGGVVGSPSRDTWFKHYSDGSGTLESVQHNFARLDYVDNYPPILSADGKYVVVSSQSGQSLGVFTSTNSWFNILRIKTGM